MKITDKEITAVQDLGFIASRIDDLRHMTKFQWIGLAGYAVSGAAAGYLTDPTPIGAAVGAIVGIFSHLVPLMSTSPHDKAIASQEKAVEAKGAAEIAKADKSKSLDQAAADFAKEMRS